jgi:hypothetical protein
MSYRDLGDELAFPATEVSIIVFEAAGQAALPAVA